MLTDLPASRTQLTVRDASAGQRMNAGTLYLAKPDRHLTISRGGTFHYVDGTRIRHLRSSANPLFETAARFFGPKAIAVVLTGSGMDGTDGVQSIKASGGTVIAQDPKSARHRGMPAAAIQTGAVDLVLPLEAIAPTLMRLLNRGSDQRP
jgi:two-component system chemotaxis response regulator CheB